jgi:hypothetical protein
MKIKFGDYTFGKDIFPELSHSVRSIVKASQNKTITAQNGARLCRNMIHTYRFQDPRSAQPYFFAVL